MSLYEVNNNNKMSENLKIYSRKQLINWVECDQKSKFEQLRNGVFFCKVLGEIFPEDFTSKVKVHLNPISEYDCTNNLNIIKKILNKYGLQLNLNINSVLSSKNCFEFANWVKNLVDGHLQIHNQSYFPNHLSKNIEHSKVQEEETQQKKRMIESPIKKSQKTQSLSKSRRVLSMAKSQTFFLKEKNITQSLLKLKPLIKKPLPRKLDVNKKINYITNKDQENIEPLQIESKQDDFNQLLYERALEESIQSLHKILEKVKRAALSNHQNSYPEYVQSVRKAIFTLEPST